MVKATATKNKIKSFFTKNEREVYIERGKYNLEKELRKRKIVFSEFLSDENIKKICDSIHSEDLDDIYLSIGNGKVSPNGVINIIDKNNDNVPIPKNIKITSKNTDADIIVSGIDKFKVNLANCCNPVFGDEIVGYITKGNGISVHRISCHNLEMLEDRTVNDIWNSNINKRYLTSLLVTTDSEKNHMLDLVQIVSTMNVNVDGITTISRGDTTIYQINCYVTGLDQLSKLIMNIVINNYVINFERAMK